MGPYYIITGGLTAPMPTYVYRCQNCDVRREAFQKMTDDPLTTCEECGGSLRRVLQPVGIVFKGSGFYVTDYKRAESGSNGKGADSGSPEAASSEKSVDSGTSKAEGGETKPAAEKAEKKESAKPVAAAS
jgi:putative FmdB family regulatory protein